MKENITVVTSSINDYLIKLGSKTYDGADWTERFAVYPYRLIRIEAEGGAVEEDGFRLLEDALREAEGMPGCLVVHVTDALPSQVAAVLKPAPTLMGRDSALVQLLKAALAVLADTLVGMQHEFHCGSRDCVFPRPLEDADPRTHLELLDHTDGEVSPEEVAATVSRLSITPEEWAAQVRAKATEAKIRADKACSCMAEIQGSANELVHSRNIRALLNAARVRFPRTR